MLPTIYGKPLYECDLNELRVILDNPDYHENEYLDFKQSFPIFNYTKENRQAYQNAISEFRGDVCSFANADSGYLVYGVKENGQGVPIELTGVSIDNKDHFELNIKNWLGSINPRIPNYSIKYIELSSTKYVIILFIRHDSFAPYIYLEDEKDYRIYKRVGNGKKAMSYSEMKNMFTRSIVLDKEIEIFRNERIDYYRSCSDYCNGKDSMFMLLHMIPESFLDSSYNQPLFYLERKGCKFYKLFSSFDCLDLSAPMVDGLRYINSQGKTEGRLFNNGIAEFYYNVRQILDTNINPKNGYFPWEWMWCNKIEPAIKDYSIMINSIFQSEKYFVGFSLIGCKGVQTTQINHLDPSGSIDRDKLVVPPMQFYNNSETILHDLKQLKLNCIISLGVRNDKIVNQLITDLYG